MLDKKDRSKLYCFSPEVMIITFLIEMASAIYIYIKNSTGVFNRLVVAMLIMLAAFQLAEYQICDGNNPMFWTRIGFVAITLLPALGLHMVSTVTGKTSYVKLGYVAMVVFALIFAFIPKSITNYHCGGNYIIFTSQESLSWIYGIYYFGFLLLAVWEAYERIKEKFSHILLWIMIGYASFMVPMGIIYIISPSARSAVPSIMCGFAVLFAIILVVKVVPEYQKEIRKIDKRRKK